MKKRGKAIMIGAAAAAVSLFAVTALASTPNTAGYDAFKEVLKANHAEGQAFESAAVTGSFSMAADGETVLSLSGAGKVRHGDDGHAMSGDFDLALEGFQRSGSLYSSGEDAVYFVDRTHDLHYQVINLDREHADHRKWERDGEFRGHGQPMGQAEEALLDFLVGDLKQEFAVANHADGSRTITVDVSQDEIPLPLRLLIDAAAAEERGERTGPDPSAEARLSQYPFFQGIEELRLEERLPELKEGVAIERVQLRMTVDASNRLQRVDGKLEVSGKDTAGAWHRITMEGAGEIGGLNATTPDAYDPGGKAVEIVDAASFGDRR